MDLEQEIFTVSQVTTEARLILEKCFQKIWVSGEISNLVRASSGHWYFSLKDDKAQVRCAFFRAQQMGLRFLPENGQQIMVQARVSLYEPRGDFQLIVQKIEPIGDGALQLAFNQLKERLQNEGLFSEQHKKELPEFPKCIGVVTSPTGAAIRDILHVLNRRASQIPVIIYPSLVQGKEAAAQVSAMIKLANQHARCDVLIVARGGGSLEDLWPFNEEIVARAIFASKIPIITGVGHEIDFTIADFVADVRAPTPSAAAELVSPDLEYWQQQMAHAYQRLNNLMAQQLKQQQWQLRDLTQRLPRPTQYLQQQAQRVDSLEQTLHLLMRQRVQQFQSRLQQSQLKLQRYSPHIQIQLQRQQVVNLAAQLRHGWKYLLQNAQQQLGKASATLEAISPLATMARGYSIAMQQHEAVKSIHEVNIAEPLQLRLRDGELTCKILESIKK